jgi:hypothetical protein
MEEQDPCLDHECIVLSEMTSCGASDCEFDTPQWCVYSRLTYPEYAPNGYNHKHHVEKEGFAWLNDASTGSSCFNGFCPIMCSTRGTAIPTRDHDFSQATANQSKISSMLYRAAVIALYLLPEPKSYQNRISQAFKSMRAQCMFSHQVSLMPTLFRYCGTALML